MDIEILNKCQYDSYIFEYCNNDNYWKDMINEMDIKDKPKGMKWREYYIYLNKINRIPIYYNNQNIGYIWIKGEYSLEKGLGDIYNMYKKYGNKTINGYYVSDKIVIYLLNDNIIIKKIVYPDRSNIEIKGKYEINNIKIYDDSGEIRETEIEIKKEREYKKRVKERLIN